MSEHDQPMSEHDQSPVSPDPPYPAGAPEPPNLDVDPRQFMEEPPTIPAHQDVTSHTAIPEPPD